VSTVLKLKQKRQAKHGEAQALLDAIANGPEARHMSPEERSKFDGLMGEVETLKGQISDAKKLEADADDEDFDEVAPEPRSRRSPAIDGGPAIHTGDKPRYSYHRAIEQMAEHGRIDGLEAEISRELEIRIGKKAGSRGFYMPTGQDPIIRDASNRWAPGTSERLARMQAERRDLTTSTGAGSIFNVPELPLIELLRAKLVIKRLCARMLTDMKGLFAIPRQSGKATIFWPGEGNSASLGNPTLDQVPFIPKVAIAATNISRLFSAQTSLDAEQFTKEDLAESMAREFDRVAINGLGTGSNQPLGVLQNTTIQTNSAGLALGASGGVPTWATIVGLESQIAALNADGGKMAYLTSPTLRGVLKQTPKIAASPGFPDYLWHNTQEPGVGEMNGYPAYATTTVPNNLTKGSGSGLSALFLADWSQMICAMWEGVEVLVNPFTNQLAGATIVSTAMTMDVQLRHLESFAFVSDAI
jgi:HK97 family phage major capsid protein